jgi:hypothetical protein
MQLVGLSFQNYKAFRTRESIEIRPLTVLIGRNSSGKSAVARLPLLLAGALSDRAEAPLPLEVDGVDFGGSFVELIHNQQPHGAVDLGATFEDGGARFELQARVQNYKDAKLPVVEELSLDVPGHGRCSFEYLDKNPMAMPRRYRVTVHGQAPVDLPLGFGGLRPDLSDVLRDMTHAAMHGSLSGVAKILGDMEREVSRTGYLGPFRPPPQRLYRDPGALLPNVGRNGVLAASLLGSDAQRKSGEVVRKVGEWYRDHLGGWALDVVWSGNTFSIVVRSPENSDVAVNLMDVGAGLAQVLPLIVQRQVENLGGKHGGLEIMEEPESQLHPGAHGDLADLYVEAAKHPGARFIIETHSENFILRVRRRVAEHYQNLATGLDPSLVRVYWIDDIRQVGSRVKPIEVLPDGDVSDWPEGVFSEDFDEVCAIREAQGTGAA